MEHCGQQGAGWGGEQWGGAGEGGAQKGDTSQRCVFCWKRDKSFPKTVLGKGAPLASKFIDYLLKLYLMLWKEKGKDSLPIEFWKLEGDKVFTCFNNIKHVQRNI